MKIGGPKPGALRLDDVLDYLNSPEGQEQVKELRADLVRDGAELDGPAAHPLLEGMPEDLFEAKVTEFLYGNFLTKKQVQAAIPQGVVYALAHVANEDGTVSPENVDKIFGKTGSALFTQIAAKIDPGQDFPTHRRKLKYKWLPTGVIDTVARSAADDGLKARMPVLDEVSRALGGANKLKGFESIAVQHLFPSTRWLYNALSDNGLDKSKTTVIGKPYSTDQDTFRRLRTDGWEVSFLSDMTMPTSEPGREFNAQQAHLAQMFKDVDPKTTDKRFLLLDEGGKTLKALHEHFPEYAHLCVGVEHTDRGIQLLEDYELKCPVINVAQSEAKKLFESPMIGESVVASIEGNIHEMGIEVEPKEACVLGYGAVGMNVAESLKRRGYKVHIFDTDPEKMQAAREAGFEATTRDEALAHAHLLIGATGRGSFSVDEMDKIPKNAILANAASGRHELGIEAAFEVEASFKTADDPHEIITDEGIRTTMIRGERRITGDVAAGEEQFNRVIRGEDGSERIALRNGFVVNMEEDIPPEFIQLTRALILAGCIQAAEAQRAGAEPGLIDLKPEVGQFIIQRVRKHLKKLGLSLEKPDFRGIMDGGKQ